MPLYSVARLFQSLVVGQWGAMKRRYAVFNAEEWSEKNQASGAALWTAWAPKVAQSSLSDAAPAA